MDSNHNGGTDNFGIKPPPGSFEGKENDYQTVFNKLDRETHIPNGDSQFILEEWRKQETTSL